MKRLAGVLTFFLCWLILSMAPSQPVQAQAESEVVVDGRVADLADVIANVTVLTTQNIELDGMPHTVHKVAVDDLIHGAAPGEIYIATPGGTRSDGSWVLWSHTPTLTAGDTLQAALAPADGALRAAIEFTAGESVTVFALVDGDLSVEAIGQTDWTSFAAVPPYILSGFDIPSFPRDFRVNPAGSGLNASTTVAATRKGFDLWENDPGSDVDFTYRGTTSLSGLRSDQVTVVSWQNPNSSNGLGASLARTYISFSSVTGYEFDIIMNRNYNWSNGVSGTRFDIGSVVAHEAGHGLGLTHQVQPMIAPGPSELMHYQVPSSTVKPLGNGDIAGIRGLYPASSPRFTGTTTCPAAMPLDTLGGGVVARDGATGTGYLMWSQQRVQSRFPGRVHPQNAANLIMVVEDDQRWYADVNTGLDPFTPRSTDCLLGTVNFSNDTVNLYSNGAGNVKGVDAGYDAGDMTVTPNRFAGAFNAGEFAVTGTMVANPTLPAFTGNTACQVGMRLDSVGAGITARDGARGIGYFMWSEESVRSRFGSAVSAWSSKSVISVVELDGHWFVDVNTGLQEFTPRFNDCLLGSVNYSADTVSIWSNVSGNVGGVAAGFSVGDFSVTPNRWAGAYNAGEFAMAGTIVANPNLAPFSGTTSCPATMSVGAIGAGVAAMDEARGIGFLLWSQQDVRSRFTPTTHQSNTQRLVTVIEIDGHWFADVNSKLAEFTPRSNDCLLASVNYSYNTASVWSNVNGNVGGVDAGFNSGSLTVTPDRWFGSYNPGEFGIAATTLGS